jgi:hypothetical protein
MISGATEMLNDPNERNLVEELLDMAKEPDAFSKSDLGIMLLVAATEIMKLRETAGPGPAGSPPFRLS